MQRNRVMHTRFIVVLGIFLGSPVPAIAQTPAPHIVLTQARTAPPMTMLAPVSALLPAASFPPAPEPAKSPAQLTPLLTLAYERDHSLQRNSPIEGSRTLFLTQASLPLVRFWGGRLQLSAFKSTLHIQNVQFASGGYGGMQGFGSPRQCFPGGPPSLHLTGLSLTLHFGRDTRARNPAEAWRRLSRMFGTVLD